MENFTLARAAEHQEPSGLQSEWLDSQIPKAGGRTELALAVTRTDKQDGPGKDVADRLDKELRSFADAKLDHPSDDMLSFQKMIGKFCDSADKKKAMEDLGDSYSRLNVQMEKRAEATYDDMQAEAAKNPARKGLDQDYQNKLNTFFDKVDALPDGGWKVMEMMEWKDGETKAQHQDRVRAGLKDNKDLLNSYNSMEAASDKVDASKSAKERELEALHNQQISDFKAMKPVVNKAYIRSTIEY